ncbi:MAG: hypothetical protein B6242_04320 [Anaerolineaceae bacterium 4572_78]|nr:MAG: hypothetical protein B6242_04320 [Anaerolineaceae bacterium 4572_78]
MSSKVSQLAQEKATQLCNEGLEYYRSWDAEKAFEAFEAAISLNGYVANYYLYLAQTAIRLGDYDTMRKALGGFISLENDSDIVHRFEQMFSSAMDEVETNLTQTMPKHNVPLEIIGAAIQMWLEFRVAMGRSPISMRDSHEKIWAAALDFTIRKVNFYEVDITQLAKWYEVNPDEVKQLHDAFIGTLDVMPCDYRYFRGKENPLDKLVEAAIMLEELEERFYSI